MGFLSALFGSSRSTGRRPSHSAPVSLSQALPASLVDPSVDPVRAAVLSLYHNLTAAPEGLRGHPHEAARQVALYEFLAVALSRPLHSTDYGPAVTEAMAAGRVELRAAIGIQPDAIPALVVEALGAAVPAIARGDSRAAQEALSDGRVFAASPRAVLKRLGALPRLPVAADAVRRAHDVFQVLEQAGNSA